MRAEPVRKTGALAVVAVLVLALAGSLAGAQTAVHHTKKKKPHHTKTVKPKGVTTTTSPPTTTTTTAPVGEFVSPTLTGNAAPALTPAAPGSLTVIFVGKPISRGGSAADVPVEIWNGTRTWMYKPDVAGSANSGGKVVGSGDSLENIEPVEIAPGAVAFGDVFFSEAIPATSTFQFLATAKPGKSTYFAQMKVTTTNIVAGSFSNDLVGTVSNPTATTVTGPIGVVAACFTGPTFVGTSSSFVSGTPVLAPGGTGSFSINLSRTFPCTTYEVGADGFGRLP